MKSNSWPAFARAFFVIVGLVLTTVSASAAEPEARVAIPATAGGIWQAIDQHMAKIATLTSANTLSSIHVEAFAVRDLVQALPAHSQGLSAEALAKVQTNVKFVQELAARLDKTGDANDKAGTEANAKKLDAILKALRTEYPGS